MVMDPAVDVVIAMSERERVVQRARALHEARDAAGVVSLLESLPPGDLALNPRLVFYHADALRRLGRRTEALAMLANASSSFDRRGNDSLSRMRWNVLGAIYFEMGRIDEAETAWRLLLDAASAAADEQHVARANQNLGAIYTLHVRGEEAIASYERAMAAYRSLGYRRGLAQCHHNLGLTYRELQLGTKADAHFVQAVRYAIADDSEDEVARAEQERALLIYAERQDAALARVTASRALDRFTQLKDASGIGEAQRVLGLIELGEGDDRKARNHLAAALSHARSTRNPLLEAETCEAMAVLEERGGQTDAAHETRARASDKFMEIGAVEWGRRERERVRSLAARPS